jgi:diguanylate cyclase
MISLRKHIENYQRQTSGEQTVLEPVLSEFRDLLHAIGECADRAVPNLGVELTREMTGIQTILAQPVTLGRLTEINGEVRNELSKWADQASFRHQDIQRELREVISVLTAAAQSVSERDEKYTKEIGNLTGQLGSIAKANDLVQVRRRVVESTLALEACVGRMAEDSKASVYNLTAQVREYQVRLEEAERESLTDPLTNLANRRAFEKHLASRVAAGTPFCLIMIDLNDFKAVNDQHGHLAGDDLLKQFAGELGSQFSPSELVARFGGDEFVGVLSGGVSNAGAKVERIRRWTLGEYKIRIGDQCVKTLLRASVGVAVWDGTESGQALLARADQELYRDKQSGGRARVPVLES